MQVAGASICPVEVQRNQHLAVFVVLTNYSQCVINGTLITKILWKCIHIQPQEFQIQTSTEFIVIFICTLQQQ